MESTRVCPIQNTSYPTVRDSNNSMTAPAQAVTVDIEDAPQTAQRQPDESTVFSSVDTLKQALSFPGMKWCLREYFNKDKADQLMEAKDGVLSADHRKKLARFLRHACRDADGKWYVESKYDFSTKKNPACKEQGLGRIYGDVTLGALPKDVRNYIADRCKDVDVKSSHPTTLLLECQEAGVGDVAVHLKQYVEHRQAVLEQLGEDYGLSTYEDRKQAVVVVLNGGSPPKYQNDGKGGFFLHKLKKEVNLLSTLLSLKPEYASIVESAKKLKGRVTFLHYLMCRKELQLLVEIASCFMKRGQPVNSLIYDGLLVRLEPGQDITAKDLEQVVAEVRERTGCEFDLAVKPMDSPYTELLAAEGLAQGPLVDDDYAAGVFVDLYGPENFRLIGKHIHLFNKDTGMWGCDPADLQKAVHRHKGDLLLGEESKINYGGDSNNVRKMLSMVPNHIEADNEFYAKNLDSSLGKLLFKNGIYDFDTDKFSPGFDPKVVFKGRIDRNFDRCRKSEAKAHLLKVMWEDPYTKQQLEDGVSLCERIALARALWGDYRARKFYIMVGNTSTGKGLLQDAVSLSCGSFVGTFDINAFVRNPNSGADAAKQLSWLKMIVDLRIALSSEASANSTLDGVLLKMAVSGGDRLTLRRNHENEEICVNRCTIFAACNDVPKIVPCDNAVVNRVGGVFEKLVSFLANPNHFRPDHEKKVEEGLKDLFKKPEYQSAFLSILLDAYQTYKKHGHTIPGSVTAAINEWVVNEAGLTGLLSMAYETVLDANQRPSKECWVPFSQIREDLLVNGVGDKRTKLNMTDTKLGTELSALGYEKTTKGAKTRKGRSTTVAVRYGLRRIDPDDVVVLDGQGCAGGTSNGTSPEQEGDAADFKDL